MENNLMLEEGMLKLNNNELCLDGKINIFRKYIKMSGKSAEEILNHRRELDKLRQAKAREKNKDAINERRRELRKAKKLGLPPPPIKQKVYESDNVFVEDIYRPNDDNFVFNGDIEDDNIVVPMPKINKNIFTFEDGVNTIKLYAGSSTNAYLNHWNTLHRILKFDNFVYYLNHKGASGIKTALNKAIQNSGKFAGQPYSINSKKSYVQIIVWMIDKGELNDHIEKQNFGALFDEMKLDSRDELHKKQETETVMNYDDYLNAIETHPKFGKDSTLYFIAFLTGEITCRDDYYLKIVESSNDVLPFQDKNNKYNDTNYVIVPKNKSQPCILVYHHYKTKKKYGEKKFTTTKELSKVIRNHILKYELNYGDYMVRQKKMGTKISQWNRTLFPEHNDNENITQTTMRHMVISLGLLKAGLTSEDRVQLAKNSFHNPMNTQADYKRIVQQILNKGPKAIEQEEEEEQEEPLPKATAKPKAKPKPKATAKKRRRRKGKGLEENGVQND